MAYILGVDIGGTKVAAALMEESGRIVVQSEVPSDPSDKEKMFGQVVKSIEQVLAETNTTIEEVSRMGVGVAGKVDSEKGIAVYQNNLPWNNFPLLNRLKIHFSMENISLDNDVAMAAYAEWLMESEREKETFVYLTVSTGISCAIIHNGSFIRGGGFAGEIGLFPVVKRDSPTLLERLEKVSSGPAIQRAAEKRLNQQEMSPNDFFLEYLNDDDEAKLLLREVVASLAHGIYSIICLLDPNRIVIGGGVFNHQPYLLALVKEALKEYLIPEQMAVLNRIQVSQLKGNAGVIGAGLVGDKKMNEGIQQRRAIS